MEEDEEVDIVGGLDDFMSKNEREISNISSGQILSCEYTVHPRWLTDNNDGTELWPDNLPKQSSQDEMELVQDEVVIEEPAPIDFNWCEEQETEEISNCGDIILEQDIPASLEEEVVTNSGTEADYDDNDNSDYCSRSANIESGYTQINSSISCQGELMIEQMQQLHEFPSRNPRSLLKNNFIKPNQLNNRRPLAKFKQTLFVNKSLLKLNQFTFSTDQSAGTSLLKPQFQDTDNSKECAEQKTIQPTTKFKQKVTLLKRSIPAPQTKKIKSVIRRYKERSGDRTERKAHKSTAATFEHLSGMQGGKSGKGAKMFVDLHGENITINHDAESGDNLKESKCDTVLEPIKSEFIKVENETESDIEIDIESDTPNDFTDTHHPPIKNEIKKEIEIVSVPSDKQPVERKIKTELKSAKSSGTTKSITNYSIALTNELESVNEPIEELKLIAQKVTELEKYFHSEFFEGRPTKTPERYLKIRDFILNSWNENKPAYVSKTTVRNGLKHCGDVNCISRIHCMLEQIGAINYGHAGDQFVYIRPLSKLKEHFTQSSRNKSSNAGNYELNASSSLVLGRRQRMKSFSLPTEKEVDANYTVSHVNGVPTLVFPSVPKEREIHRREATTKAIKIEFELIECLRFTKDKIPPFKVSITLSTLLCLHLHALSCKFEVMGFLGGFCTKSVGRNKLSLTRYKPCKTAHQSGTTCEMCPVSQVEQASSLTSEGYELLGWFHSHPTFEPNPSRTDVATQADMQQQFSIESDRPFIGFILGCIDMRYNCMYILPKDLESEPNDLIPYGLDVDIIKDCSALRSEIGEVFNVIDRDSGQYFTTIEKFTRTANDLLKQHGYDMNILDYIRNYL